MVAARGSDHAANAGLVTQQLLEVHRRAAGLERTDGRVVLVFDPHVRAEGGRDLRPQVLRRRWHQRAHHLGGASDRLAVRQCGRGVVRGRWSRGERGCRIHGGKYTRRIQYSYSTVGFPSTFTGPLLPCRCRPNRTIVFPHSSPRGSRSASKPTHCDPARDFLPFAPARSNLASVVPPSSRRTISSSRPVSSNRVADP